jgi:eukaryotic-like serine/threonine-protein kinase
MSSTLRPAAEHDPSWLEPTWIIADREALRADDPLSLSRLSDIPNDVRKPVEGSSPSSPSSTSQRSAIPAVRMVDEEHPDPHHSSYALLRARLTAAAWVILGALGLLFLYQFCRYELPPRSLGAGTLTVIIGSAVLLTGRRPLDAGQLRLLELAIFGVAGVQLLNTHLEWLAEATLTRSSADLTWAACTGTVGFAILVLAYGMFMPNGWKRTAAMLVPPTLAPIAAVIFVRLYDPFARDILTPLRLWELSVVMLGAWGIAVYGTWTISNLRSEYRKALRFGQYRLKRRIGRGGMGEVYLAEHRLLKRPCAIKLIRANQVEDAQSLVRFEREVRATAGLSHWNTVEIYDYGHTEDGTFYYVMEYLPGLNLSEMVHRFGPLCPERVVHFLIQTCDALIEAHAAGLIHRDLKPANIFAAHRGGQYDVGKLLDFGLVVDDVRPEMLVTTDATQVGPFAGSPLYMAPEQASGDLPADPRSDLYSLGATGYCLLTGHPPFEGKSPLRLMIAHARDPVTPPTRWEPCIPRDVEQIILRCLEKNPGRRYASIRDLRQALSRCSVADKWTQDRAAQWWRLRAPALNAAVSEDEHIAALNDIVPR